MRRMFFAAWLLPRPRDLLFLLVFAAALAAGWRTLNTDGDLPRHLLMGRVIVESGSVPRTELFSYVYEGRPYVAHEWLADVSYFLAYKMLGLGGVVLLTAVLLASTFFLLYAALSRFTDERLLMLLLLLWGAAVTFQHWIARPHLFSMLFLALWVALADRLARGERVPVWILPGVMVVWANTHAEFVAGLLVLAALIAGWLWDRIRDRGSADRVILTRLLIALGLSTLASLVNPFGIRAWTTLVSYLGNSYLMSTIHETRPPTLSNPSFYLEFALILFSVIVIVLRKGRIRSGHAFLLAGFTALALAAGRNIHLYGVVAPYVLMEPLAALTQSSVIHRLGTTASRIEQQLRGVAWPILIVAAAIVLLVSGVIGRDYSIDPKRFPVEAVTWLERNPQPGRMFNEFKWGGYIVWRLWPGQKDFIDSQSDVTGGATRLYYQVRDAQPGWQEVLDRTEVAWTILPGDASLNAQLIRAGWTAIYTDGTAVILQRP